MRLSWSATNLGTRLGLSSGTAVLVREEEKIELPAQERLAPE